MRKFDPWPVFFKREYNRNWPFLVGFATTGNIITPYTLSLTEEGAKKFPFVQRHQELKQKKYVLISTFATVIKCLYMIISADVNEDVVFLKRASSLIGEKEVET